MTRCGLPLREPARTFHMSCKEVAKTHARQVAYQECNDVPEQKCSFVPKQVCVTVLDEICTSEPVTDCEDVPEQHCHVEHKKFPVRISRKEAKKVCNVPGENPTLAPAPAPVSTPVLPQYRCYQVPHLRCQPSQHLLQCQTRQL